MLILTRHPGQSLSLHPHPTLDPGTPVEQLFAEGPIQVQFCRVGTLFVPTRFVSA